VGVQPRSQTCAERGSRFDVRVGHKQKRISNTEKGGENHLAIKSLELRSEINAGLWSRGATRHRGIEKLGGKNYVPSDQKNWEK